MNFKNLYNKQDFEGFRLKIENDINNGLINKSINILLDCVKNCPDHSGIYFLTGKAFYSNKEYNKAIQYFKQAIYYDELNDEYQAIAGITCYYNDSCEEAYKYSKSSNEINPKNIQSLITLGLIQLDKMKFDDAINYAKLVIALDENNYDGIRLLTKCYMKSGTDSKILLEYLKKAKKLKIDEEVDIDIIKTLYIEELYEECQKECKKILLKNPNSISAQKARELVSKMKTKEAKIAIKSNIPNSPNNKNDKVQRQSDSLEEALDKLNSMIGLSNVKTEVSRIVKLIEFEKNRARILGLGDNSNQSYHFMFLGNPGTGKTTVARLIGDIFYYLGLLENGQMTECDRSTIVGQYIGQTAVLTKEAIDNAMGGVLFIDEAYSLARGGANSNDFGPEAIDTLVKAMEDHRGKFIVILAGYTKEMRGLIKLNPGLKSRVNLNIEFLDYSEGELLDIGTKIASTNHYNLDSDAQKAFIEKINKLRVDDSFANGRTARNIIEAAIREKAFRIGNKNVSREELSLLRPLDFGIKLEENPIDKVENLLKDLNDMIGLKEVKAMISKIVNFVQFQHRKKEMGLEVEEMSLNMVFIGNPGTGKTTIARIISNIFNAMGILKKGHLVEVTRDDLVGQYIGQTGSKTLDKIKEAYGGVLFIDEAYSLNSKSENDFGKEAVATLIKEMEDSRDKLVVIMAGYTDEMKDLLNMNPGVTSRIGFTIEFPDYKPGEMMEIFKGLCAKSKYTLDLLAEEKLNDIFKHLYDNRNINFGNARLVRQYFQQIKMKQAERVISHKLSVEFMFIITEEDLKDLN
ncbi:AAA family ATPase [Clostridium sp.]|uniref:AAA family ATPase n=1 Tax=Clostridium sp. TaxID=1506 RepID=UPI003D6C79EB